MTVRKCAKLGDGKSNQTRLNNEHPSEHEISRSQIDCLLSFSAELWWRTVCSGDVQPSLCLCVCCKKVNNLHVSSRCLISSCSSLSLLDQEFHFVSGKILARMSDLLFSDAKYCWERPGSLPAQSPVTSLLDCQWHSSLQNWQNVIVRHKIFWTSHNVSIACPPASLQDLAFARSGFMSKAAGVDGPGTRLPGWPKDGLPGTANRGEIPE